MKVLNIGSCNLDYVYSLDHIVAEGETDMNISEIIKLTGYENESYFRRKFKEMYGISPNRYRKTERAQQ